MFNVENAINLWCAELHQKYRFQPHEVDELRDHLQCEIERLTEKGLNEEVSFSLATEKIGASTELSREIFKVGFTDRIRRLPNSLVAVSVVLVVLGLIIIFPINPPFSRTVTESGIKTSINFTNTCLGVVYFAVGLGLLYLNASLRTIGLFFSGFFIIVSTLLGLFLLSIFLKSNGPVDVNIGGEIIAVNKFLFLILSETFLGIVIAFNIWIYKVLTRPDIKLLFGFSEDRRGLSHKPLKTFKWLPY